MLGSRLSNYDQWVLVKQEMKQNSETEIVILSLVHDMGSWTTDIASFLILICFVYALCVFVLMHAKLFPKP